MSEADVAYGALEELWAQLYAEIEGARFERRGDLDVAICPGFSVPPFNAAWVVSDTRAAAGSLPEVLAEIEASGEQPWVQCRQGQSLVPAAARELGLSEEVRLPCMVAGPGELQDVDSDLEVALIADEDVAEAVDVLAAAFEEPRRLFERFAAPVLRLQGARWYTGRRDGELVSTAVGAVTLGAVGIFNVATLPAHGRRGYGGALTVRAARDGFGDGAELAYLQSSQAGYELYRQLGFREVDEYLVLTRPHGG